MTTTKIDKEKAYALTEELSSYVWGILVLVSLAILMLMIHIGLSIYFHN